MLAASTRVTHVARLLGCTRITVHNLSRWYKTDRKHFWHTKVRASGNDAETGPYNYYYTFRPVVPGGKLATVTAR